MKTGGTLLTALFLLAGCQTIRVDSDFDRSVDFARYETFSFISQNPLFRAEVVAPSPLLEGRLMEATRRQLSSQGYRYSNNADSADFVVAFTLGARDKIRVNSYPATYRTDRNWAWGSRYYTEVDVRNYTEGTLAIDFFDVESKRPVWHGRAVKTISQRDRANPTPLIRDVVAAILAEFPPASAP